MALTDNLVAFWELEEASGSRADSVGDNDLTSNNNVGQTTGKVGNAASLALASQQYLSVADNADLRSGDHDFTIVAWAKLASKPSGFRDIVSKWTGPGNLREFRLGWEPATDRFQFQATAVGTTQVWDLVEANSFGAPEIGEWCLIIAWHDSVGDTLNIQINNGVVDSKSYSVGVFGGASALTIGAIGNPSNYFDGAIDQVGIWKRVLSDTERAALWNEGNGMSYADILNWQPDNGGGEEEPPKRRYVFGRGGWVQSRHRSR